jgi:hypothetical protein
MSSKLQLRQNCGLPCHRFPNISCAQKNSQAFFQCLMYHFQNKLYVKCPKENTRHTELHNSGIAI